MFEYRSSIPGRSVCFLRNVLHCLGAGLIAVVTSETISNAPQSGYCLLFVEKLKIQRVRTVRPSCKIIELKIGTVDIKEKSDSDEAYSMEVDPSKDVVRIVGKTPRGVFWGAQSLLSIVNQGKAPWVTVKDAPRYEYRGLSIDVARNFLPKKEVMKILDGMATFKMNKLHLHLTDDEGWRLEIPGLPQLTEVSL